MATTRLMTAEDLWDMGEESRHELIRGELHEMAPTGEEHSEISALITGFLMFHAREHGLGAVYTADPGFILARGPDVVLAPDVAFVRAGRLPAERDRRRFFEIPPDLAVEVVSPSDSSNDVADKVMTYLNAGVQLVWEVQPRLKTVTVHYPDRISKRLTTDDELDGGDVLPGFKIAVAEIFS